ncbi:MAG TPA: cadherin repeat domain-containing protein, partial [Candidatus Sulfotelmatobacter sp.]|nr:cadherin repeat domain-containing protein [Candidatus Sulfotelmatobacter sp.]
WVEDNGLPRLSATNSFRVLVVSTNTGSVNTPPIVTPIADQNATVGQALSFTVSATDTDTPPQTLTFGLEPGAPQGAAISTSGQFSWTPASAGSYPVTVRVTDNGIPPLSATISFSITVVDNVVPQQLVLTRQDPNLVISWPQTSANLVLQYSLSLGTDPAPAWANYTGPLSTNAGTISVTLPVTTNQFFRLYKP